MTSGSQGEDTDRELIERWKAGDSRAATELVGRHADALARFAVSAGERTEIEELVQTHDPEREDFLVTVFKSEELGFYSDEFESDDDEDDEP